MLGHMSVQRWGSVKEWVSDHSVGIDVGTKVGNGDGVELARGVGE